MKVCFKCGTLKPINEFYAHRTMKDGHLNKCIECAKSDTTKYRHDNLGKVLAYDRARNQLPHRELARQRYKKTIKGATSNKKAKEKYRINNKLACAAHMILNIAIKGGRVKRGPCEVCGSRRQVDGHHDDYTKPLEVHWLCHKHHMSFHQINGSWRDKKEQVTE